MRDGPPHQGPKERLPAGLKRLHNQRLLVDFQDRFPDGTAFRRTKEFDPQAMRPALVFLERAKADLARGNGVGQPKFDNEKLTVAAWCLHCVDVIMPAQRNGRLPKYSDEALERFREIIETYVAPGIGKVAVADLDKATVTAFAASLPSDEARTKTLNVLTRAFALAEIKGTRKKGTSPCKGVLNSKALRPNGVPLEKVRPDNWREADI